MKGETEEIMTELQRRYVRDIEQEIQSKPGGKDYKVYTLISIIRIQNVRINKLYRLWIPTRSAGKKQIRTMMMSLFQEMKKEEENG